MTKEYHNVCIRCGKERIVLREWKEKFGYSTVINTEMICPDPQCQKKVEKENRKQVNRYRLMKKKSDDRLKKRRESILKKRISRKKKR